MTGEIPQPEQSLPEHEAQPPRLDFRVLSEELGFSLSPELEELRRDTLAQLLDDDNPHRAEIAAAYKLALQQHVIDTASEAKAQVGVRVEYAGLLLEADAVGRALDELWEAAYQAGQTPGIESLREGLEQFVSDYTDD